MEPDVGKVLSMVNVPPEAGMGWSRRNYGNVIDATGRIRAPEPSFFQVKIKRMVAAELQLPISEAGIFKVAVWVVDCVQN